ncbi:UNVERIFIED_CONTAM: hypothetical protein Sindi_1834600 [Sesamum indicum]
MLVVRLLYHVVEDVVMVVARHFYQFRLMLPKFGKQFFDHPHHLTRPHCPPPRRLEMMLEHLELHRQLMRRHNSLPPWWLLHHYHQSPHHQCAQYISLDDAKSDGRFHERINAVVTGILSPPIAMSEAGAKRVPAFLMTYWWDYDDESMFLVFHMLADK